MTPSHTHSGAPLKNRLNSLLHGVVPVGGPHVNQLVLPFVAKKSVPSVYRWMISGVSFAINTKGSSLRIHCNALNCGEFLSSSTSTPDMEINSAMMSARRWASSDVPDGKIEEI